MIDQDGRRLHKDGRQGNRAFPLADTAQSRKVAIENYGTGYVEEVFRNEDRCAHIDLEKLTLEATRGFQFEPGRIDERASKVLSV